MDAASRTLSSTSRTRPRRAAAGAGSRATGAVAVGMGGSILRPRVTEPFDSLRLSPLEREGVVDLANALPRLRHPFGALLARLVAGEAVQGDDPVLRVHVDLERRKIGILHEIRLDGRGDHEVAARCRCAARA